MNIDTIEKQSENNEFKNKIKTLIQNISNVIIPLILIANITISRIFIAIVPSLVSLLFLIYEYYETMEKKTKIPAYHKYSVVIKEKTSISSYRINQMYTDVEYYIDKMVMVHGKSKSIIDESVYIKTLNNNYCDYRYSHKIPDDKYIDFIYNNKKMSIFKHIAEKSNDNKVHNKCIWVLAEDFNIIKSFLDDCKQMYMNYVLELNKSTYNFYRYDIEKNTWIKKQLKTIKNYNNVLLPIKLEKKIKNCIKSYNNSKDEYSMKGIPYKLGILFYGIPGCGKTSLTYAIAYETKRNIYQIPLNESLEPSKLKDIIDTIPEGNIVLFEEVDTCSYFRKRTFNKYCSNNKKYDVKNKKETLKNTGDTKVTDLTNNNTKDSKDKDINYRDVSTELQTSALLEILDGYNYLHDSIVIMYTNHLNTIDEAIIRPGRIDHCIELTYADSYQIKKAYNLFYNKDISDDIARKITNRKITTSHLINTCIMPYYNNFDTSIIEAVKEDILNDTIEDTIEENEHKLDKLNMLDDIEDTIEKNEHKLDIFTMLEDIESTL